MNIINIIATCEHFEINENVQENKAEARLKAIKKMFQLITKNKKVPAGLLNRKTIKRGKPGTLKVTTTIIN